MAHISDIKLIRTDTTLDLSQKAEKGMICLVDQVLFLYPGLL
ncbi:Serine/threonine-protein kinase ZRK7 [Linum grandiflorum]